MKLSKKQKRVVDLVEELTDAVEALLQPADETTAPAEPEKKDEPAEKETAATPKKRGRRTKAQLAKDAKKDEESGVTVQDVRDKLLEVIEKFGNEEAKAILDEFGADKVSKLDAKDYPKVLEACQESLDDDDDE